MHITNRVGATLDVTAEVMLRSGAAEWAVGEVIRRVVAEASRSAWKVRPESVHISRRDGDWVSTFTGLWSPLEARFVGGEYDGDMAAIERRGGGYPLAVLTLPYRAFVGPADNGTVVDHPTSNPCYERSGIDPIDDVWVYTFVR